MKHAVLAVLALLTACETSTQPPLLKIESSTSAALSGPLLRSSISLSE